MPASRPVPGAGSPAAPQYLLLLLKPQEALARGFGRLCQLRCLCLQAFGAGASLVQRRASRSNLALGRADFAAERLEPLLCCCDVSLPLRQGLLHLPSLAAQRLQALLLGCGLLPELGEALLCNPDGIAGLGTTGLEALNSLRCLIAGAAQAR